MKTDLPLNPTATWLHSLVDAHRLAALDATRMMNSEMEDSFDQLTRLAAKALNAPFSAITFIGDEKLFFKSSYGIPGNRAAVRSVPVETSICRFTLAGQAVAIEDTRNEPHLADCPAIPALNLVAYLGVPLITKEGHVIGAFGVFDQKPRRWTPDEIELLTDLTRSVMNELALRLFTERLETQNAELKSERELRERFVATLSHDLRNPLSAARMQAQMIIQYPQKVDLAPVKAGKILVSLDRVELMIQNLLDVSHVSSGQPIVIKRVEFDLDEDLNNTPQALSELFNREFVLEKSLRVGNFTADREGLRRAIENLSSNAVKYGDPEKPITLFANEDAEWIHLGIANEGRPIPKENFKKLFDPFHRGEHSDSMVKGWGLGLALVKAIAEGHGGKVGVESSANNGTRFTISLPKLTTVSRPTAAVSPLRAFVNDKPTS